MIRNFTTEAEEKLYEYVDIRNDADGFQTLLGTFETEEYLEHADDTEYLMSHLDTHHQMLIDKYYTDKQTISEIFNGVRQYDLKFSDVAAQGKQTMLYPYKEAMRSLLNCVEVTGRKHNGYPIFLTCDAFEKQIGEFQEGIVGETYLKLQDPDAFEALMLKSIEEIKPWETQALMMMADDCMALGDSGYYELDLTMLEAFIEKGYIPTDMYDGTYQTYVLSPAMRLLANELNNSVEEKIKNGFSAEEVKAYCCQADILYSVAVYYGEMRLMNTPDNKVDLSFVKVDITEAEQEEEIEERKLHISVLNAVEDFNTIIICEYSSVTSDEIQDELQAISQEKVQQEEDILNEKRAEQRTYIFRMAGEEIITHLPCIDMVADTIEIINEGNEMNAEIQEAEEDYEEAKRMHRYLINSEYFSDFHCSGSVIRYGETTEVLHVNMNKEEVCLDIATYNVLAEETNSDRKTVDYNQVIQGFETYSKNGETNDDFNTYVNISPEDDFESGLFYKYWSYAEHCLQGGIDVDSIRDIDPDTLNKIIETYGEMMNQESEV